MFAIYNDIFLVFLIVSNNEHWYSWNTLQFILSELPSFETVSVMVHSVQLKVKHTYSCIAA
jgi:hypothetical protein